MRPLRETSKPRAPQTGSGARDAALWRVGTSPYLKLPTGQASFNILKMAHEGLMLPLRTALEEAKNGNKAIRKENVKISQNGHAQTMNFEVVPLKNIKEQCYLVFFEGGDGERPVTKSLPCNELTAKEESSRIQELESELAEMHDYLQSLQEQQEAANEELQASNEEVTSSNEELQSINEELETSKEELESTNEELITINEEMNNRNAELNRLNSDLVNLQTSTKLAIVLLGRNLTIRRFSTEAEKLFNLLASDLGRPIANVRHHLVFRKEESSDDIKPNHTADLESFIAEVIDNVRECEHEVRDEEGRWYSLRVRPYLTLDNKVDGAVMVLVDIDTLKRTEQKLQTHTEELTRFNDLAVGRELRMIELKKEINELCERQGEAARYSLEIQEKGDESHG